MGVWEPGAGQGMGGRGLGEAPALPGTCPQPSGPSTFYLPFSCSALASLVSGASSLSQLSAMGFG